MTQLCHPQDTVVKQNHQQLRDARGTNTATYSYLANSPLVSQVFFQQNGSTKMTTRKEYDFLNRLTRVSSTNAQGTVISSSDYLSNEANQRIRVMLADGSY